MPDDYIRLLGTAGDPLILSAPASQWRQMVPGMLTIDGSQGEGGGQVLRSALALSLVTGRPFAIENIRAGRKKPGLLRQHLTAVLAAAEVGRAEVEGATMGSRHLVFRPSGVRSGNYAFRVGTAGSATLVLQTVLPALLLAEGESNLTLEGGTHNPFAPPVDFLVNAYLPLVNRLGPRVEVRLIRPGFYPAGGGEFTVRVQPARQLGRLALVDRGQIVARRVRVLLGHLPRHIAERETPGRPTHAAPGDWCLSWHRRGHVPHDGPLAPRDDAPGDPTPFPGN